MPSAPAAMDERTAITRRRAAIVAPSARAGTKSRPRVTTTAPRRDAHPAAWPLCGNGQPSAPVAAHMSYQ
jgi:hypothetical protein